MYTINQLWSHRYLIANLTQRELKSKHKRTVLGWLWSLLNPAATIAVYTIVFGSILQHNTPVAGNGHTQSFPLYLFCGLVMWGLFSSCIQGSIASLRGAGTLLQKVAFPTYCPPVASAFASVYQTCLEGIVLAVVMAAVGNLGPTALLLPLLFLLMLMFGLGLGMIVAPVGARYGDVSYVVGIALHLGFFLTPFVYPMEVVPEKIRGFPVKEVIRLNPITQFVEAARDLVYHMQVPSAARLTGLLAVSAVSLVVGWFVFLRTSADISEVL